jgi:hypothetical protein
MSSKLEWSFSALSALRRCNRMYYFQYLAASHHFTNPLRRRAHELKKSKSLLMWRGSVVDKIMETEIMPKIKDKQPVDYNKIADLAVALAKRQFEFSKQKLYKVKENSESKVGPDYCILDVHDTNVSYTEDALNKVYSSIREIITNIPAIYLPDGSRLVDFLGRASFIIPNLRAWSFEFENLTISPQLDLFMFVDNKAIVLDWKVSESEVSDYSRQLVIGGITVYDTYRRKSNEGTGRKLGFGDIRLIEVNLLKQSVKEHPFNKQVVDECIDYIYLNSHDVEMLTEGKPFKELNIEDFPITDKGSTCIFCKYRSLCSQVLMNNNQYHEKTYNNVVPVKQPAQLEISF